MKAVLNIIRQIIVSEKPWWLKMIFVSPLIVNEFLCSFDRRKLTLLFSFPLLIARVVEGFFDLHTLAVIHIKTRDTATSAHVWDAIKLNSTKALN